MDLTHFFFFRITILYYVCSYTTLLLYINYVYSYTALSNYLNTIHLYLNKKQQTNM